METSYQLNKQSETQQRVPASYPKPIESKQLKMIISLVVGIITSLAGLFILLAAHQILPNGINAISQWQVGSTTLSAAMVAAGIAAITYGAYQAHQLRKMKELYTRISNGLQDGEDISNKELVEYFSLKIQDGKLDDINNTFSKLDLESQGELFAVAAEEGRLCEMVDVVPKNIKQIKFHLGNQQNFDKACHLVDQFVLKLSTFTELNHMVLDLSGVAYYTDRVHDHTERMLEAIYNWGDVNFGGYEHDSVNRGGLITSNNAAAANRAMTGLLKYMKNNSISSADVQFKDHLVTISKVDSLKGPKLMITKIAGEGRNEVRSYG